MGAERCDYLPKTITKDVLFKRAQERFQEWCKMYGDPNVSAQWMYEDMSASCYCGCPADDFPADDFPDEVKAEQDSIIRYQYNGGGCFFIVDDIKVDVFDLRDMRDTAYVDVCIPSIMYKDESSNFIHHPIPDAWLYGSTSVEFNEGMPVHQEFINAARGFIKLHHITKELQEVD